MSDFNADSRGKRPDSLGSLDSDTLTTDAGEHGWRGPSLGPTRKRLDISLEETSLDANPLMQESLKVIGDLSNNNQTTVDDDEPTMHSKALDDSFTQVGNQNLKEHFDRLQAISSVDDELRPSKSLSSSDDEDIMYEADVQDQGRDESLFVPAFEKSFQPSVSMLSEASGVATSRCISANAIGVDCSFDGGSSDGESIQYETDVLLDHNDAALTPINKPCLQVITKQSSMTTDELMVLPDFGSSDGDVYVETDRQPLLVGPDAQMESRNFAMEHRIFVKALLALLAQRDMVEVDMDDPNTLKCGPLKKATSLVKGAWKFKYVEIRRGMFSYYDDSLSKDAASEGDLVRKNIKLNATTCTIRAVKLNHKSLTVLPSQAIFELTVEGSPRRFWMTNSRQERMAWIRALQDAMVGSTITARGGEQQVDHTGRVGKVSRRSPYKRDLGHYLKIQREIKNASTKQAYVGALYSVVGKTLNVPVQWISEQGEESDRAFREEHVSTGVDQLWKDLARDSVQINGELFKGGSGHAVERIIGALTCEIMRMDRSSPLKPANPEFKWIGVTELQALSFARDVLLSGNRTRSGGDSYYCVDALCQNPDMVVLVPSSLEAEPLSVTIGHFDQESLSKNATYSVHDRSGWVKTRTRHKREWRRRYFVLSEGTLTFYRKAHPRPYAVEGQIKIHETPAYVAPVALGVAQLKSKDGVDANKQCFVLTLKGKEGLFERQLLFESKDKFLIWAYAIEAAISTPDPMESPKKNLKLFQMLVLRDEQVEAKDHSRIGFVLGENSLYLHANMLGFETDSIVSRAKTLALQHGGGTKSPTVNVSVCASTMYKVCTLDPQGDENEDTWANVRATFLQNFTIAGGPNGLMNRSEEVVQINILGCSHQVLNLSTGDQNLSPRMLAGSIGRKLRRGVIGQDEISPAK